ncbi:hypothetical protein [Serratia rhizosphaerae]|uniref:hypothetical protein n=1 Tax=Serratia rhizosphaerae TaxID=2597702 RepID=UPI002DBD1CC6|nr:hypothetical protein [Serratia rhizosphaerae]MEB6336390.1 hypothetical protein [Serratia rhizosphaerae]
MLLTDTAFICAEGNAPRGAWQACCDAANAALGNDNYFYIAERLMPSLFSFAMSICVISNKNDSPLDPQQDENNYHKY